MYTLDHVFFRDIMISPQSVDIEPREEAGGLFQEAFQESVQCQLWGEAGPSVHSGPGEDRGCHQAGVQHLKLATNCPT